VGTSSQGPRNPGVWAPWPGATIASTSVLFLGPDEKGVRGRHEYSDVLLSVSDKCSGPLLAQSRWEPAAVVAARGGRTSPLAPPPCVGARFSDARSMRRSLVSDARDLPTLAAPSTVWLAGSERFVGNQVAWTSAPSGGWLLRAGAGEEAAEGDR
jgi:hypothetical protein